jgi:hypothetical protein
MQIMPQDTQLNSVLTLPRAGRTAIFGMTGAGKTILADTLRSGWLMRYLNGKVLIVDSKPHYRAQWQLNGVAAKHLYRKWDTSNEHDYVPGSIVLPVEDGNIAHMLKMAFKKTRVVIVQGGRALWKWLLKVAQVFYEFFSNKQGPRLLDVDEAADFFEVDRFGGILLQSLRAGRQLGLGVLMGSQRPVFLPKATLTESDRLYILKLKNEDDLKTIQKNGGLPKSIVAPTKFYEFRYYNFYDEGYPSGGLFKLGGIT